MLEHERNYRQASVQGRVAGACQVMELIADGPLGAGAYDSSSRIPPLHPRCSISLYVA